MRTYLPVVLVLAGATAVHASDSSATDYWVRVMPELWLPALHGTVNYQGSGVPAGTTLNTSQLGIDGTRPVPQIEAGVQIPFLFSFAAGADFYHDRGTETFSQSAVFGTKTYSAGDQVTTTVSLKDYWGEIAVRPLNLDRVGFSIGLAFHDVVGDLELHDTANQVDQTVDKSLPIPALALRAHVRPFGSLTIEGRVHAIEVTISGQKATYVDAAAQLDYRPIPVVGLLAGYRYTLYDLHLHDPDGSGSSALLDVHLGGPFVGLIAEF